MEGSCRSKSGVSGWNVDAYGTDRRSIKVNGQLDSPTPEANRIELASILNSFPRNVESIYFIQKLDSEFL